MRDRVALTEADILADGDAFTREIYDFTGRVHTVVKADVARAIVDLNRGADQLPPDYPDGVVKSVTCYNKTVYKEGRFPDQNLIDRLIRDYYQPYHSNIRRALQDGGIAIAFDCHSMASQGPPAALDCGKRRPTVNIGNVAGKSCPTDYATKLAACFREVLQLQDKDVTLNKPFSGGFITRNYATRETPWLQIEISRDLYLAPPWFDPTTLTISQHRLSELNAMLWQTIRNFWQSIAA